MRNAPLIELLEDRIAPAGVSTMAVVSAHGKVATYTDSLGDLVTVTVNKGAFTADGSQFHLTNGELTELDLTSAPSLKGADLAFSITPASTGGLDTLDIGYINASGLSLHSVTVPGDLSRIDIGGGASALALSKLTVQSLGAVSQNIRSGLSTTNTFSNITGTVGDVEIAGSLMGTLNAIDYKSHPGTGNINKLVIHGSLDGSNSNGNLQAGEVEFSGTVGSVLIGGGIVGGGASRSGEIFGAASTLAKIGTVAVMGSVPNDPNPSGVPGVPGTSILGGSATFSGRISVPTIGKVTVAGTILGGLGPDTGVVEAGTSLGTISVGGSLIGANFDTDPTQAAGSGAIYGGKIGSIVIGGDIDGGSALDSGRILSPGLIQSILVKGSLNGGSAGQTVSGTGGSVSQTPGLAGSIVSHVLGSVVINGSVTGGTAVAGDSNQTALDTGGIFSDTTINSLTIYGSLVGGSGSNSGEIDASGHAGSLVVKQNVIGGSGSFSGNILVGSTQLPGTGNLTSLVVGDAKTSLVGGSILGGSGDASGRVFISGTLGKALLYRDLTGGSGPSSGEFTALGTSGSLTIGGNVTGGTGSFSGDIGFEGTVQTLNIQGNFVGGSTTGTTKLTNSGYLQVGGITTLKVGGDVTSGTSDSAGLLDSCGAIRSMGAIGSVTAGALMGNANNPVLITAVGKTNLAATATTDVAIGHVTVLNSAQYADILAGYSTDTQNGTSLLGTGVNADAQIGTVQINGDAAGLNVIAGLAPGSGGSFGTADSTLLKGPLVSNFGQIIAKISSVIIRGTVTPTASTTDAFGIGAQQVASVTVGKTRVPLLAGPDNDTFAAGHDVPLPPSTQGADLFVYEV